MLSTERLEALHRFAERSLGFAEVIVERASADASFRSYWRVLSSMDLGKPGAPSWIVMNAPPDKEDVRPWLDVARRLRDAGLNAPDVIAEDLAHGFVLMSYLGAKLYLPALDPHSADALYGDALGALFTMQTKVDATGLPPYDDARLKTELELFPTWFLERHLGVRPGCDGWDLIEAAFTTLLDAALEQPRAFVHRDYHSRNLLIVDGANPGIVDFQDAVVGPVTYDLVSLLRDCYIEWPSARVHGWMEAHRKRLVAAGVIEDDALRFKRWFDLLGLQRHLKVLGIFCRLWYRDGKRGYLADLPLTLKYTLSIAREYVELEPFARWLEEKVGARDVTQPVELAA
jgi:aminoglycoside/choline kinase family phosphotransferase